MHRTDFVAALLAFAARQALPASAKARSAPYWLAFLEAAAARSPRRQLA